MPVLLRDTQCEKAVPDSQKCYPKRGGLRVTETQTASHIFDSALQERQPVVSRLLTAALERRALGNAYLLTGRALSDKWALTRQLAAFLNCLSRNDSEHFSCLSKGVAILCQNCQWISQGEHPQAWMVLEGQGASGMIPVDKARQLVEEMNKTSRYMRVVVVPNADQQVLHAAPANALLKNIEEPQANALWVLFAASEKQVLPTIVSRSQVLPMVGQFKPGLWIDEEAILKQTNENSLPERAMAIKSEFIHAGRKRLQGSSGLHGSLIKAVTESQETSSRFLELCDDDSIEAELLLDIFLAAEMEVLNAESGGNPQLSLYLSKLAELTESAKNELSHYVKKNNVLETFAYSLTELRLKYLGDFHLAKN